MIYHIEVYNDRWNVQAMPHASEMDYLRKCNKVFFSTVREAYYCYIQIDIGPYYPEKFVLVALARGLDIINKGQKEYRRDVSKQVKHYWSDELGKVKL